jgi:hypothetical protein
LHLLLPEVEVRPVKLPNAHVFTTARQSTRIMSGQETDENVKSSVRGDVDHRC